MEEIIAKKYRVLSVLLNERQSRLWSAAGLRVSKTQVGQLLHEMGYFCCMN